MLTLIGYWTDTRYHEGKWIHPKQLVDPIWEVDRRGRIVAYLRSGVRIHAELGYSYCRFDLGPPDSEMGDSEMTDGTWVWPQGLAVYVERFKVRLPDEFLRYMKDKAFCIPTGLDAVALAKQPVDVEFWKAWCLEQRWNRLGPLGRFLRKVRPVSGKAAK